MSRSFLVGIAFLLATLVSVVARAQDRSASAATRPSFLFIISDDQRYDAIGIVQKEQGDKGRFPWLATPNLDRIASGGMRFRNAFVVNSLCAPSRANFLSGQYSHLNGVVNNHTPFPETNITHATLLKAAGYRTAYFGKWHCDGQKERPGFDHVVTYVGQGRYDNCPLLVNGKQATANGWVDDVITDYAIEFLKQHKHGDQPFDMVVGFKSPHDPSTPPDRAKDRFAGAQARPVANLDLHAPYRAPATQAAAGGRKAGEGLRNKFRCISAIDDCVGRILDTLDELKIADNTVVVFVSDNGYLFGEHSLGDKRAAYEESIRIPMLIRYPKLIKPGSRSDEMVLNIDYAPTILDLAGVKTPETMQGKSLRPLLGGDGGRSAPFRDAFFYEYFYETKYDTPTITAVRTSDKKLVKYPGHDEWTELFDLAVDPLETRNLAGNKSHESLMKSMAALMDRELKSSRFSIPPQADAPASAGGQ